MSLCTKIKLDFYPEGIWIITFRVLCVIGPIKTALKSCCLDDLSRKAFLSVLIFFM